MITELTLPASEPVSLVMVKAHLKIEHDDEDALLAMYIGAARRAAEHSTGRIIAERDFRIDGTHFGDGVLPLSPVSVVSSVKYLDQAKQLQVLSGIDFCPHPLAPQLFPPETGWPQLATAWNAVQVVCTAGMNPVPADICNWIVLRVATAYENREALVDGKKISLDRTFVDALLDPYRVVRL